MRARQGRRARAKRCLAKLWKFQEFCKTTGKRKALSRVNEPWHFPVRNGVPRHLATLEGRLLSAKLAATFQGGAFGRTGKRQPTFRETSGVDRVFCLVRISLGVGSALRFTFRRVLFGRNGVQFRPKPDEGPQFEPKSTDALGDSKVHFRPKLSFGRKPKLVGMIHSRATGPIPTTRVPTWKKFQVCSRIQFRRKLDPY